VRRWSALPRGGHFAALEEPELLAREIRAFFRPLREIEAGHDVLAPVAV
jgi:pimeloyl-ACP methyl ester carboxylesterase